VSTTRSTSALSQKDSPSNELYRGTSEQKLVDNIVVDEGVYAPKPVHFAERKGKAAAFADDILLEMDSSCSPELRRSKKNDKDEQMVGGVHDLDQITVYHLDEPRDTTGLYREGADEVRRVNYETETLQEYVEREL
jgi:hypothetical protein